jgi:hypothetical protein
VPNKTQLNFEFTNIGMIFIDSQLFYFNIGE